MREEPFCVLPSFYIAGSLIHFVAASLQCAVRTTRAGGLSPFFVAYHLCNNGGKKPKHDRSNKNRSCIIL